MVRRCVFVLVVTLGVVLAAEKYTDKFDNLNIDEILKSERLVTNYIKCILNKGPCPAEGIEFKKNAPDALQNDCSKCTELQKAGGAKVFHFMLHQRPKDFAEIEKLYDPTGVYRAKYYDRAKAIEDNWKEK